MTKTIVVFGASGTIGLGLIKASLQKGDIKVVGVFRSEESAKKVRTRLGNPTEEQLVSIVGSIDTEKNAEELQKKVTARVGEITDVVVTVGAFAPKPPLLQLTAEDIKREVLTNKLVPHFLIAKYFLPLVQDKEGTSYTFINGSAAYTILPGLGHQTIANATQMKLTQVLTEELKDKPVRINDFVIDVIVTPWDNPALSAPPQVAAITPMTDNVKMGEAILGVVIHPSAKGAVLNVGKHTLEKLAQTGNL